MMRKLGKLWLWIVYAFLFLPIFVVIVYSFNAAKYTSAWKGFTLKWYSQLFGNAALIDAVVNTLSVAALAASLATLLGVLAALCLKRTEFPGRQLLHASLYVLTVSPEMVMGISLLIFFISVKLPLGFVSMLIAHTTLGLPFVFRHWLYHCVLVVISWTSTWWRPPAISGPPRRRRSAM